MRNSRRISQINRHLLDAVILGDVNLTSQLLAQEVQTDVRDREHGETALMLASQFNRPEIARLLIENGANVNARDNQGQTPCMYAKASLLSLLVANNADINAKDRNGETALMKAVERADTEKVHQLIEYGADLDVRDNEGRTALDRSAESGLLHLKQLLTDKVT